MEKYFYFCMFVCTSSLCKSCEQFWKECCDCFYHEELIEKSSGRELLPNENSKDVVEIENSQVIKNSKEVVGKETLQDYIDHIVELINKNKRKRSTFLCVASILKEPNNIKGFEEMNKKVEEIFKDKKNPDFENLKFDGLSSLEKRSIGSMLGMGIGDAYGSVFEFMKVNKNFFNSNNYNEKFDDNIEWHWKSAHKKDVPKGCAGWSDDSSMGLCLADSLIVNNGIFKPRDIMNRFLAWWYCSYNNASMYQKTKIGSWGLGGNIKASFENYISNPVDFTIAGDKDTSGNGSIMRNAAIPIAYHNDLNSAMEYAGKQSKITHQGDEAAGCCRLLTYIVGNILEEKNKDKFNNGLKGYLNEILSEENVNKLDLMTNSVKGLALSKESDESDKDKGFYENWNWKKQVFEYNEERKGFSPTYAGSYAMDNMAMSLHILYYTTSFKQAINVATHLCGDSDSVASVVGQIAGAFYGVDKIPVEWIKKLYKFDRGDFTLKALLLAHLFDEKS